MAETIVKKIPLQRITSNEEYEQNKKDLQYYLEEHRWYTSHDSDEARLKDIDTQLEAYKEKLGETPRDSEERKEVYHSLHALKVKYLRVKDGTYDSVLRNNIKAEMIMLDEYDTQLHKIPFGKVIRGLLTGDKEVREYARKKLVFVLNNSYGMVEKPYDLHLEPTPTKSFVNDFKSSFVDTDTSEFNQSSAERGLTVYREEPGSIQQRVAKIIQRSEEVLLGENQLAMAGSNGKTYRAQEIRNALGYNERQSSNSIKNRNDRLITKKEKEGSEDISK